MAGRTASKSSRVSLVLAGCAAVAALYFAQEVLIPLVLALLLTFLLAPAVRWLERRGLGRIAAVLAVVCVAFLLIFALGWVVAEQVADIGDNLPQYQDEIVRKVRQVRGQGSALATKIESVGREIEKATSETQPATQAATQAATQTATQVATEATAAPAGRPAVLPARPIGAAPDGTMVNPVYTVPLPAPRSSLKTLGEYLGLALGPLGTGALVIVFVIFMLLEREDLRDRMIRLVSGGNYMVTTRALNDAGQRISRYMLAQSIVNGAYGLVIATGLWLIGLVLGHGTRFPSFVLWGLLCALLRFIPYIGPWVASAFPVALSLAVYPGFTVFTATACLFILVEIVSNNVMEPWLYGASTGMSTMAILASAVFWTWLWGPVGLLLATPLTVCIVVMGKYVPRLRFLDVLLGDEPALPRHVTYYQRLLAGDREEAARVVADHAREHGVERAADQVLVPALRLARKDRRDAGLSAEQEAFIVNATVESLRRVEPSPVEPSQAAEGDRGAEAAPPPVVLGCAAHHRVEEIVVEMLAVVARPAGFTVRGVSTRTLPGEIEEDVVRTRPAAVFIAVLPPGGLEQARYLCRRLRRRFERLPIVVGYFGRSRNFDRLLVRLRRAGASYVTTSLVQARSQLRSLVSATGKAAPSSAGEAATGAASTGAVQA